MSKVGQVAAIKLALVCAVLLALTTPGEACHRYSHWAYPWPQKCPAADSHETTSEHAAPAERATAAEHATAAEKPSPPKMRKRFKAARTILPTTASDSPSAADLDRLRAALIRKLQGEPKQ